MFKKLLTIGFAALCLASMVVVPASASPDIGAVPGTVSVTPQRVVEIIEHEVDGEIFYEYVLEDAPPVSTRNLDDASWVSHNVDGRLLLHRAAKEHGTDGYWNAASQTNYSLRHYTRCQVVQIGIFSETVRDDSERVYADSGTATARTTKRQPRDSSLAMRSYWG